jgi:hypothetical protein
MVQFPGHIASPAAKSPTNAAIHFLMRDSWKKVLGDRFVIFPKMTALGTNLGVTFCRFFSF